MNPPSPSPRDFADIQIAGELKKRLQANFNRLEETKYQPDAVYLTGEQSNQWDGDTEGRTILGLTLLAQATGREPRYLAEILRRYPAQANPLGYLGRIYPPGTACEQQLSGHGWLLRGLCETYLWRRDPTLLEILAPIIANLALPTAGLHRAYPIDPAERSGGGSHSGTEMGRLGDWFVSTDTGCDFIFMDGLMQACQILPSAALQSLVSEMIERFLQIDLLAIKAQTHASLTAVRGLLRWYETSGDPRLLRAAAERFDLYTAAAMTANGENFNWFGRPEWTEPCAVVDSFLAAVQLWRFTARANYLETAHTIYFNALGVEQRYNGGFGCNTCGGAKENPFLEVAINEAHWCCTMRGAEGLARAAQYAFFTRPGEILLPFLFPAEAAFDLPIGGICLRVSSSTPYGGKTRVEILESDLTQPVALSLFLPSSYQQPDLRLNGRRAAGEAREGFLSTSRRWKAGDRLDLTCTLPLRFEPAANPNLLAGWQTISRGPLRLGLNAAGGQPPVRVSAADRLVDLGGGQVLLPDRGLVLQPVHHLLDPAVWQENGYRMQVMF